MPRTHPTLVVDLTRPWLSSWLARWRIHVGDQVEIVGVDAALERGLPVEPDAALTFIDSEGFTTTQGEALVRALSHASLHRVCAIGCVAAGLLLVNVVPRLMLVVLWARYLSWKTVGVVFLNVQWDALLLETLLLVDSRRPRTLLSDAHAVRGTAQSVEAVLRRCCVVDGPRNFFELFRHDSYTAVTDQALMLRAYWRRIMRRIIACLLIVALSCLSMSAFAQTTDDSIDSTRQQFVNLDDYLIVGEGEVPGQTTIVQRPKTRFEGGVDLARSFMPEIKKSTADDALDQ